MTLTHCGLTVLFLGFVAWAVRSYVLDRRDMRKEAAALRANAKARAQLVTEQDDRIASLRETNKNSLEALLGAKAFAESQQELLKARDAKIRELEAALALSKTALDAFDAKNLELQKRLEDNAKTLEAVSAKQTFLSPSNGVKN